MDQWTCYRDNRGCDYRTDDPPEPIESMEQAVSADQLREELAGAQATIAHMSEAMSWISGHDRQGLDHLQEATEACAERDDAQHRLRRILKLHLRDESEPGGDPHCVHCAWVWPCPTVQCIDQLALT